MMPAALISTSPQLTLTTECKALIMVTGLVTNEILNYQGWCDKISRQELRAMALIIESVRMPVASLNLYHTTRRNIPQERRLKKSLGKNS
jgi:hypothetical protein